jgi:hypothetical protein
MSYRFLLIFSCFIVLTACDGGSRPQEQGEAVKAGYKLPTSIDVLEAEE